MTLFCSFWGMENYMATGPGDKPQKLIGEMLVDSELITPGQLEEALAIQKERGGKIVAVLMGLGHLTAESFMRWLAENRSAPSIDIMNYNVPQAVVDLVPHDLARSKELCPIDKMGSLLTVAMMCPFDTATIDELHERTGLRIKPVLCSSEDIGNAMRRYYPDDTDKQSMSLADLPNTSRPGKKTEKDVASLKSPMKLLGVVELIRNIQDMPTLPETVEKVREAMADIDISIESVSHVIERDPPIAAKMLGVANSAAYGLPRQVDNLQLAISLLGLRETYSIVLAAAVVDQYRKGKMEDMESFWRHSFRSAVAALVLGPLCGQKRKSALYTAGLLHGIGRIALSQVAGTAYRKVDTTGSIADIIKQEEEILGLGHPEAGFELVSNWNLPEEIAMAVRYYHRPADAEAQNEFVACINIAQGMAKMESADDSSYLEHCAPGMEVLDIKAGVIEGLAGEFLEKCSATEAEA